jgi:N-acetylmuramoyl-L-alanine amidase
LDRPLRIVIDPGHGGWDIGSVGPTGLQEKELALDVAQRLRRLLEERLGAETLLTRLDDTFITLEDRPAFANSVAADVFLSIHGNSSPVKNVRGVETYYVTPAAYKGGALGGSTVAASRRLATAVQHALYTSLADADPLINDRGIKAAALSVLEAPTMPSVLTEISFVTSTDEEQKLRRPEYRDTIAEALFKGIAVYVKRTQRPRVQSRIQPAATPGD